MRSVFPQTKFEFPLDEQLETIRGEVNELEEELEKSGTKNNGTLYEAIDVIYSTFTLLYNMNYSDEEIREAINGVVEKNEKRNYYDRSKIFRSSSEWLKYKNNGGLKK